VGILAVHMWTELCEVYPLGIFMVKDRGQFSKAVGLLIGQSLEGTPIQMD